MLNLSRSVLLTVHNYRTTVSHKSQKTPDSRRPYASMMRRGRLGLQLWDPAEPCKTVSVATWTKHMGKKGTKKGFEQSILAGNCRLLSHTDAEKDLAEEGVDVTDEMLLIPTLVLDDQVSCRADIVRIQSGDNEKEAGRIPVPKKDKYTLCIDEKSNGLDPKDESDLKWQLGFDRRACQFFASLFKAEKHVEGLRKRIQGCTTDAEKLANLEYTNGGSFPLDKWPANKMVTLFSNLKKRKGGIDAGNIVEKIEELLENVLSPGGAASTRRLGFDKWESAAEETPDGSLTHALADCVDNGSLAPITSTLKSVLSDTPENVASNYDIGLYVVESAKAGSQDAIAILADYAHERAVKAEVPVAEVPVAEAEVPVA